MIEVVSQQSLAKARGRLTERARVLELLGKAEGSVPQMILDAIAQGTTLTKFESSECARTAKANARSDAPARAQSNTRGSTWSKITARANACRRRATEATDLEGSAS